MPRNQRTDGGGRGQQGDGGRQGQHSGEGRRGRHTESDGKKRHADDGRKRERRRKRSRDDNGQFTERATEADVLGVFDAVDGPVVTTTDVGDVLGVTTEAARQKLNRLVRDGPLRRRKTGRTVFYWQVDGE